MPPTVLLSLLSQFYRSSPLLQEVGAGSTFPSQRFLQGRGPSLVSKNLKCRVPSPKPSKHTATYTFYCAPLPVLSWGQESMSLCTPLINPPSCTEWKHITPTILPSFWQGSWVHRASAEHASALLFKKSLSGHSHSSTEPAQLSTSPKSQESLSHSQL